MNKLKSWFYHPSYFAFSQALEENWTDVYREYLNIQPNLQDWQEKKLYGEGWQVFGLFNFPHGGAIEPNVKKCPLTVSLVQQYIPTHGAAGFSVLQPMTKIKPHQGYQGDFLRCHLGLKIPNGNCFLKVEEEIRRWQEGKVLIFDDRVWHEAWNLTETKRVILLVDFVPG